MLEPFAWAFIAGEIMDSRVVQYRKLVTNDDTGSCLDG
jgi:hypothetical protein